MKGKRRVRRILITFERGMHVGVAGQSAIRGEDDHMAQRAHDRLEFKRLALGTGKLDAQGGRSVGDRRRSNHAFES